MRVCSLLGILLGLLAIIQYLKIPRNLNFAFRVPVIHLQENAVKYLE
jgi:uncharacterized membrane protein